MTGLDRNTSGGSSCLQGLRLSLNERIMIVCVCRGVSDREVRRAVAAGAACLETLERCGIGGDCRGCESMLRDMIVNIAGEENACRTCCAIEESALATA